MSLLSPHVLEVDRLTAYLRMLLDEDPILADVWVRGEVTNFSRSAAGHCYFSLSGEGAQLRCVLFRTSQRGLLVMPRNGDVVLAHGRVSIYESSGQYQLYVDNVAPEGTGVLQLEFEELRRRLEADGLFAPERKRSLPLRPKAIGVVTSAQGAVWHDICNVIKRRYPLIRLVLAPATVQGPGAPGELVKALRALQLDRDIEVIIVGRGGGSAEDLACFNDEELARAIYAASVPVVSAVGHETDVSIADLVADVRAPTPSAAAELCVPDVRDLLRLVRQQQQRARDSHAQSIQRSRHDVRILTSALSRCSPAARIDGNRQDLDLHARRRTAVMSGLITKCRSTIRTHANSARLLDPRDVLRRGFALVTSESDDAAKRITSASEASTCNELRITFTDGSVLVSVDKGTP